MHIERLTRADKAEVVSVLAEAFHEYPVMRYVGKFSGAKYGHVLNALVHFFCEARFAKGELVLGIREQQQMVAAALVDEAGQKRWPDFETEMLRLKYEIGETAFRRLELYEATTSRLEPVAPHYFIGMIGVRPKFQGKGYARALLNHVNGVSASDKISTGICLCTEDLNNVAFYRHFAYHVIAEVDIEELHSWCLFRKTISDSGV